MKLYYISQTKNRGYGTFDSAVVCAPDETTARNINPNGNSYSSWCYPEYVEVEYLGEAKEDMEMGVICSSFNAG
jgi:hypothetical protein